MLALVNYMSSGSWLSFCWETNKSFTTPNERRDASTTFHQNVPGAVPADVEDADD